MKILSIMRFFFVNRTLKMKLFLLAVVIFGVYTFLSYVFLEVLFVKSNTKLKSGTMQVNLDYVMMHIDLKGTPLKLSYLESLLPMLKEYGVNSLLMEYEDMFPYAGKLVNMSAENCYNRSELTHFLVNATKSGFEIIPLVQTFGHMEFVLKLPEFQHLREEAMYPDSVCPSKTETVALVKHMLEQVMDFHNAIAPIKHIHIGCDEVFHINKCQDCTKRILSDTDIFLDHLKTLSDVIQSSYPDTTVLIWDDMLRGIRPNKWNYIDQLTNVQPVYWDYGSEMLVSHANLFKYHNHFKHIWIASAYKGADGRSATFPDLRVRYQNIYHWMSLISNYRFGGERKIYNFKGIILTGWSRYSHMDPPCELLPVSITSLILHLMVIQKFKSGVVISPDEDKDTDYIEDFFNKHLSDQMVKSLNCVIDIDNFENSGCQYDGVEFYETLQEYKTFIKELDETFNDNELGLNFVEYYSKLNMINGNTIEKNRGILYRYLSEIGIFEQRAFQELHKYYASDFVTEYVHYMTFHLKKRIKIIQNLYDEYLNVSVWERRSKNDSYFIVN